jgi:hypothetical protein
MPISTLARKYTINGVVNTENPVLENLDGICRSAGSFLTYDVHQGLWSVVINTTASSVYSFDDSNIVGPIQVSTTSLFDLYNQVEVEFPLLDTADKTDFVRLEIPDIDRAPYEQDNQLKMTLNFASEPVQASLLGRIELLQSRLDKVITFESDYSALQLNAGDVIDVTNTLYGFSGKTFRIVTIKELDADDGSIRCEITALEYDATIYSAANLTRTVRSDLTGIQTLGAIGVPGTPTFVKYEASARPQINVVTTVPTGVIEGVECWISSDGTNYQLRNTIKNADTVLTPGASLTFEFDDQAAGNVYAKTRGTNYSVAGPFSNVSTTTYAPQQITDAIGNNTSILDGSGGTIAIAAALPALLSALNGLYSGNIATGTPGGIIADAMSGQGFMVSIDAGQTTVANIAQAGGNSSPQTVLGYSTFSPKYDANYKFDVIFDQNTSGANGGRGTPIWGEYEDVVRAAAWLYDVTGGGNTLVTAEGSGNRGAQFWTDFPITGLATLYVGRIYKLEFTSLFYTESDTATKGNMTFGWNVYTTI